MPARPALVSDPDRLDLAAPEDVGLSPAQLARIDEHLRRRYLEPEKIAGCLTLVARGGKPTYLSAQGLMDRERGRPMQADTIFRIYSMTKPITSVALMQLYEQGHFQLDDPVHKFIPEWRDLRVFQSGNHPHFLTRPVDRPMTIRDLFSHQSGLTYGFMERTNVDAAYREVGVGGPPVGGSLRQMIEQLSELPLEFSPGEAWNYSVATDVLAYLVEVFSGQPYDEYLRQHIFEPLGMVDTGFTVPTSKVDRFAANYRRDRNKKLVLLDDPLTSHYTGDVTFFSGGGGLVSTAHDYYRFCQMMLNGGELEGVRILGRKSVELMTMNHLPGNRDLTDLAVGSFSETTYEGVGFGLGVSVTLDLAVAQSIGSVGEYGWGGAASTAFWIDPLEDLIVIFMVQFWMSGTFNFRGQLKSIVYPALT